MEAMWARFFPAMERAREMLAQGRIGEARSLQADFGFRTEWNPEGRLLNRALGGGALLDVGVYVVSLSSMLFGPPLHITSNAVMGQTGVDETCGLLLRHNQGRFSVLSAAIRTETRKEAVLYGTKGRLEIHAPFWKASGLTLAPLQGEIERVDLPYPGAGYQFEAAHVMRCLREGRTESAVMPLDETFSIMKTLDAARASWGLVYPGDSRKPE
ncbi:MAG: Gfo/Idh/MocA family oxidoreductase [Verrucomicrobia bacterium]|nr:Gfo/Idh/MocA family oxidoreductase [Verrucomicrobiota bacterium]